jgi:hypothetical protein
MKNILKRIVLLLVFLAGNLAFAQVNEGIGTEVINVVKPYTPTISDAFKVKEIPVLEDSENTKTATITYTIFSFPVASTFVPAKGNAVQADKPAAEKLFANYAELGGGNYGTISSALYLTHNFDAHNFINAAINHLSSAGGIKGVEIPDSYLKSGFDVTYGSKKQTYGWDANLGYHLQKQHWYGIDFGPESLVDWTGISKDKFSKAQTFQRIDLGANLRFTDYMLKQVGVEYTRFWDAFDSSEIQFKVRPDLVFMQSNKEIKTAILLDHVSGSFAKDYENLPLPSYSSTSIGVQPGFAMQQDDWSFSLGTALFYNTTTQTTGSKFFIYPKVAASLKVVGDLMVFYTGIDGDLQQNTYRNFAQVNPFVSPTLFISPTNKQIDVFAGLKGKLASYLSYDVKAALKQENNKALFRSNYLKFYADENEIYTFGNSFELIYDNVKTIQVTGGLKSDLNKDIAVGVQATVSKYVLSNEAYAWNLPQIELQANAEVAFLPKWSAGTDLFFVGERKDAQADQIVMPLNLLPIEYTQTLKSYVDANFHLNYKHNARWGAFLKLNNVLNQNYQRWLNYPVQGFQVLAGASYKFDF